MTSKKPSRCGNDRRALVLTTARTDQDCRAQKTVIMLKSMGFACSFVGSDSEAVFENNKVLRWTKFCKALFACVAVTARSSDVGSSYLEGVLKQSRGVRRASLFRKTVVFFRLDTFVYKVKYSYFFSLIKADVFSGIDVLVLNDFSTLYGFSSAKKLGSLTRCSGAKLIYDAHELEAGRASCFSAAFRRWVWTTEADLASSCDICVAVCGEIALSLSHRGINCVLVPNAPLANWAADLGGGSRKSGENSSTTEHSIKFVHVGNMSAGRGIEQLLRLGCKYKSSQFHFLGRKVAGDFGEKSSALGESNIHFHDPVPCRDVLHALTAFDCAVIAIEPVATSYIHSVPNKFYESILSAKYVLCCDLPGMRAEAKRLGIEDRLVWFDSSSFSSLERAYLQLVNKCNTTDQEAVLPFGEAVSKRIFYDQVWRAEIARKL